MFVLHHTPDTAATPVRILLEELALPYTARRVDREGGELASPGYRVLHPLGKIPVLETPEGPLVETAAILLWLADTHAPGRFAPAPGTGDRGAFLKWLFFATSNLHPPVMEIYYSDRVAGPAASEALVPLAAARAKTVLDALETGAKAAPALFPADRPSLLGLYIGTLMRWLGQLPDGHPGLIRAADYPVLHATLAACETTAAAARVAAAEDLGPTLFTRPAR
ncbi:glutathione S-transferase family protein [Rhodobacter sp. SGA-6-6]|uniref:glutathione S-transferase family protein n=1 Tax=Rhodobacter sp. SGA-6-6 TaxID=2710882 RepID=UPI0013EA89D4|nr:glutathione S-transferase family protein [Rhodobacter sp. SGA-6-6]NGM46475.1 glutathione S-transferase family protein [Rhodobacter sp. SGA-6-6]